MQTLAQKYPNLSESNQRFAMSYPSFAAGTLVHTEQGLLPIEKVRCGMRVLTQPESGGEREYRPVTNTVATLDQEVYAVQVRVAEDTALYTLIATPNHPFWVESPLVDGQHWLATECLEPGLVLQLADGRRAEVHASGKIRQTQYPDIAFAADDRLGVGIVLSLQGKQLLTLEPEELQGLQRLILGEPYVVPVYNFTVEECHTYYVGEVGVWVHNTNCPVGNGVDLVIDKIELENKCFSHSTLVVIENGIGEVSWLDICNVRIGDSVLSRSEIDGGISFKKVLKKYEHAPVDVFYLWYELQDNNPVDAYDFPRPILTTANHPFWVVDRGWVEAGNLLPGDFLITYTGVNAIVSKLEEYPGQTVVYNLEVEDFNTYFVGAEGIWVHNKNTTIKGCQMNPQIMVFPQILRSTAKLRAFSPRLCSQRAR